MFFYSVLQCKQCVYKSESILVQFMSARCTVSFDRIDVRNMISYSVDNIMSLQVD